MADRAGLISVMEDALDALTDADQEAAGAYIAGRLVYRFDHAAAGADLGGLEQRYPDHLTDSVQAGQYLAGAQQAMGAAVVEVFESNDWRSLFLGAIADAILFQSSSLDPHAAVRVATTGPITLSGEQNIDGVSVVAGDRVLVKDQTSGEENGAYVVSAGAWTRATDMDADGEMMHNTFVAVLEGTANEGQSWIVITGDPIEVGVTPTVWELYQGSLTLSAGEGLVRVGNEFNVGAGTGIAVDADTVSISPTYPGQTSIAHVGTIVEGTWNGTAIADAYIAPALTGKTYNGLTLTALSTGFTVAGGTASKTLTVPLDASVSGTNTGDQTITLTGDVTGSGTGSFATTLAAGAVTLSKMADMATASFLGRSTAGTGSPEVLSVATAKTMLGISASDTPPFSTVTLSGLSASLPVFTDAAKGLVSNAKTGTGNVVMSASPTLTGTLVMEAATASGGINLAMTASGNQLKVSSSVAGSAARTYSTSDGDGLILNQYQMMSGSPYLRTADIVASMSDVSATQIRFFTKPASGSPTVALTLGSDQSATFPGLITASSGIGIAGGTLASGRIVKDATNGLMIQGASGASNDFVLLNSDGSNVLAVAHGTTQARFLGTVAVDGAVTFASTLVVGSDAATNPGIYLNGDDNTSKEYGWRVGGLNRWIWDVYGAESGSDAGSAIRLRARTDGGIAIDDPIAIERAGGGAIALSRPVTMAGNLSIAGNTFATGSGGGYWLNSTGTFTYGMYKTGTSLAFRSGSGTNFLTVNSSGEATFSSAAKAAGFISTSDDALLRSVSTGQTAIAGGTTSSDGANLLLYGGSHATSANIWKIRHGSTDDIGYDGTKITITPPTAISGLVTASAGISVPDGYGLKSTFSTPRTMIIRSGDSLKIGENGDWTSMDFGLATGGVYTIKIGGNIAVTLSAFGMFIQNGIPLYIAGDLDVNSGKFTVDAATGDTEVVGSLALTGAAGTVSIGDTANTDVGLFISENLTGLTGSTTLRGLLSRPTLGSAATALGAAGEFQLRTAASAFTMASGIGLRVASPTIGAGSTVTAVYGLKIEDQTGGFGVNYALHTGLGDVRFGGTVYAISDVRVTGNLIMDGTSGNYLKVPVIAGDPGSPEDGMIWFDSASGHLKCYSSGGGGVLEIA